MSGVAHQPDAVNEISTGEFTNDDDGVNGQAPIQSMG